MSLSKEDRHRITECNGYVIRLIANVSFSFLRRSCFDTGG